MLYWGKAQSTLSAALFVYFYLFIYLLTQLHNCIYFCTDLHFLMLTSGDIPDCSHPWTLILLLFLL